MAGEGNIVTLNIVHGATHPAVTLAETQVIGRVILSGFPLAPVPVSTILNIYHIDGMVFDSRPLVLKSQVIHTRYAFDIV